MTQPWTISFFTLLASMVLAKEPLITCDHLTLRGIPGEPLRLEIVVETDRANPIQLRIPAVSNLVLRTVEKVPIQRTDTGRYTQKRIILWQGTEAGSTSITNLAVFFQGVEQKIHPIQIVIDPVTPAEPPKKAEAEK